MSRLVWSDGAIRATLPAASALSPETTGGHGVFESFAAGPGRLGPLALHVRRLSWAAGRLGCLPVPPLDWPAIFEQLLDRACLPGARCRILLYPPGTAPRLHCTVEPLGDVEARRRRGVALATSPFRRGRADPTASIKHTSRAFHRAAGREARTRGADDALLLSPDGDVLETTRCNVFALLADGLVVTPTLNDGFLPGVARQLLLGGLRRAGGAVRECTLSLELLRRAEEVFLTNSVYGVLPVRRIDGRSYRFPGQLDRWLQLLGHEGGLPLSPSAASRP